MADGLIPLSGVFYRYVFTTTIGQPIGPARTSPGRFHHDDQAALYMSPTKEWASKALKVYINPGDPPRSHIGLEVTNARVADLRSEETCNHLGVSMAASRANWRRDVSEGRPGSSWAVSDRIRDHGADGLIYASRTEAERWNLVLFRWNSPGAPTVAQLAPDRV